MHLRVWTNDEDLVIATSPKDAAEVVQDHCGCKGEHAIGHSVDQLWEALPDERPIVVGNEIFRAGAWVQARGRGYLTAAH